MGNNNLKTVSSYLPTDSESVDKEVQSLFYTIYGKQDSKTKVFNKKVLIDLDSIDDLNRRISEKIKNHYDVDKSDAVVTIAIQFYNKETLTFSGWNEYKQTKITNPSPIRNFTITWACLLQLPNFTVVQPHKITVKLSDGLRPEEFMNLVFTGKIEDIEEISVDSPIVVSVDFIDQLIGDEFINIVENWTETVKRKDDVRKYIEFFSNHKRKIAYFINSLCTFIAIYVIFRLLYNVIDSSSVSIIGELSLNSLKNFLTIIFSGSFVVFFVYRISYYLANIVFRSLTDINETHIFNITRGDRIKIEKYEKISQVSLKKAIGSFILSIIISTIVSVLSTYIINLFS